MTASPADTIDLWELGEQSFNRILQLQNKLVKIKVSGEIPFTGGCLGYFSYEANHPEHGLMTPGEPLAPLVSVGLYTWALIQNHADQTSQLVFHPQCPMSLRRQIVRLLEEPRNTAETFALTENFSSSTPKSEYLQDVKQIKELIEAGDCYQVNYAQHFSASYTGDPYQAYLKLRALSPTPLAAYMDYEWGSILSLSPERFISLQGTKISTFPIKGTMPRGEDAKADEKNREKLVNSQKDRAENLMIVDLMRNDLSRVSLPASVKTPKLFDLQSFPTVHHLISEVTAELRSDCDALDLLRNCLPGGSISGAPKRRALEIIDELEKIQRSIYCGSIFYWSSSGNMDSSIAIRTLLASQGVLHCWGGGGITADSDPEQEWQETLDKVQPLMQQLQPD